MDQPIGTIHVVTLEFQCMEPGNTMIYLVESEVSNTDAQTMSLTREGSAQIRVSAAPATPPPEPTEPSQ